MTSIQIELINQAENIVGRDFDHYDNHGVHFTDGKFFTYEQLKNLTDVYGAMNLE